MWKINRLTRELGAHLGRLVHQRIAEEGTTQKKDILGLAIQQILNERKRDQLTGAELSSIVDQLKTFCFAGHDTTSTLISWTVWAVAQNPKVLQEIREELEMHVGKNVFGGTQEQQDNYITYESIQNCTFLDATLKEALPACGLQLVRADGATVLMPPMASIASAVAFCTSRVIAFTATRTIGINPTSFNRTNSYREQNLSYLPFSRGPKDCIGKYFAMLEAKITG